MYSVIKKKFADISKSRFVRSVGVLVGGTAAAQILAVIALPLLTRLYTPEDFRILAAYSALLAMLSVIACLRMEFAIPLPKADKDAVNVLFLGLLFVLMTSVICFIVIVSQGEKLFQVMNIPEMHEFSWLLPFGILLIGTYNSLQYWATRKARFPTIARTRVVQAGAGLTTQLGTGWIGLGPFGLLLGHAFMSGSGVLSLAQKMYRDDRLIWRSVAISRMLDMLKKYRNFPTYSTFEGLAGSAAVQVPVLLIAILAIGPEAGYVFIAMKVLGTPVNLIGKAVGQVYLSRAAKEARDGDLAAFTTKILCTLISISFVPIAILAAVSPTLFEIVFGEEWRRAGELVVWMAPWFLMKILASPFAMVMHIMMMQKLMLFLMLFGLALRVFSTLIAHMLDPSYIAYGFALGNLLFYCVALMTYLRIAGLNADSLHLIMRALIMPLVFLVVTAIVVVFVY